MLPVCVQTIFVRDLAAAIPFYTGALGYVVKARYGECIVQLRTGSTTLIVQQVEPGDAVEGPGTVLCFETGDILASMRSVREAGGELLHAQPQRCPVGVFVSFRDPGGAVQQLLQFDQG
jgi:predicted enzyme related to lactoylglutathione lyase